MSNSKNELPETIKCPNCGENLNLGEEERKEKKFVCSGCEQSLDMQNQVEYHAKYIKLIIKLLDNYLPLGSLSTDLCDLLGNYVIKHALIRAKKSFKATTNDNYESVYHLVRNVLIKGISNRNHGDSWQSAISPSEIEILVKNVILIRKKIPGGVDLNDECHELLKQISSVANEKQKQLEDVFVFCIESAFYQVTPKTFFIGDIYFTQSSIIFIPYGEKFEYNIWLAGAEATVKQISRPTGGLAAHAPESKIRQEVLVSTARIKEVQFGMNLMQKFIYNVASKEVGENKNDGYLYIDRSLLEDISINEGVLSINTQKSKQYVFGSIVIRMCEEECKDNLSKWLSEDYSDVSESCFISKIIAPKVLLDGLVAQKQYTPVDSGDKLPTFSGLNLPSINKKSRKVH